MKAARYITVLLDCLFHRLGKWKNFQSATKAICKGIELTRSNYHVDTLFAFSILTAAHTEYILWQIRINALERYA